MGTPIKPRSEGGIQGPTIVWVPRDHLPLHCTIGKIKTLSGPGVRGSQEGPPPRQDPVPSSGPQRPPPHVAHGSGLHLNHIPQKTITKHTTTFQKLIYGETAPQGGPIPVTTLGAGSKQPLPWVLALPRGRHPRPAHPAPQQTPERDSTSPTSPVGCQGVDFSIKQQKRVSSPSRLRDLKEQPEVKLG